MIPSSHIWFVMRLKLLCLLRNDLKIMCVCNQVVSMKNTKRNLTCSNLNNKSNIFIFKMLWIGDDFYWIWYCMLILVLIIKKGNVYILKKGWIMSIIVWKKVKNTEKYFLPLSMLIYNNFVLKLRSFFFCYNIDKGGRGDISGFF